MFDTAPRSHRELVVLLGLRGSMQYYLDGQLYDVGAGTLVFAHSNQAHFLVSEQYRFDMWVLVVAPELLNAPGNLPSLHSEQTSGPTRVTAVQLQELTELCTTMKSLCSQADLTLGVRWFLCRAWSFRPPATHTPSHGLHRSVGLALQALERDPGQQLSTVARDIGLSLTRLGQLFRDQTGMTLGQYRRRVRFKCADSVMASNPDISLLDLAFDSGFGDYSRFYRAFKSERGVGPRAYYRLKGDQFKKSGPQ